jgi:hypothetical protein
MTGMAHGARTNPREGVVFAIILIIVGVGALAMQILPDAGAWILLLIGLGFLTAFAVLREYAALIPGGILTGLGAGILASQGIALEDEATGGVIVLGLGLGFIAIWVIGALVHVAEHHPWPLVPGGILSIIGLSLLVGGQAIEFMRFWPVAVIAIGLIVLWRAVVEGRDRT